MEESTSLFSDNYNGGKSMDFLKELHLDADFSDSYVERPEETNVLEKYYADNTLHVVTMYGKRQAGKTVLLQHFIKDKPAIYYQTGAGSLEAEFRSLLAEVKTFMIDFLPEHAYLLDEVKNFRELFDCIFALSCCKQFILIMDEYSYLLDKEPYFERTIQAVYDKYRHNKLCKLLFIRCGSVIGVMSALSSYSQPMYGRTECLEIYPLSFADSKSFIAAYHLAEQFIIYSICYGLPGMLERAKRYSSVEEFVTKEYFTYPSPLYPKGVFTISAERVDQTAAGKVLQAIATGHNKFGEIKTALEGYAIEPRIFLDSLIRAQIIKEITPELCIKKAVTRFEISDTFAKFWFTFLSRSEEIIKLRANIPYTITDEQLSNYMGHPFEWICRQYLLQIYSNQIVRFVTWEDVINDVREEVDIVADLADKYLICECKFRKTAPDIADIKRLILRGTYVDRNNATMPRELYLFSRTKLAEETATFAKDNNVHVVYLEDM